MDILLLQELMLEKRDLPLLNNFNEDFNHVAYVKDKESEGRLYVKGDLHEQLQFLGTKVYPLSFLLF